MSTFSEIAWLLWGAPIIVLLGAFVYCVQRYSTASGSERKIGPGLLLRLAALIALVAGCVDPLVRTSVDDPALAVVVDYSHSQWDGETLRSLESAQEIVRGLGSDVDASVYAISDVPFYLGSFEENSDVNSWVSRLQEQRGSSKLDEGVQLALNRLSTKQGRNILLVSDGVETDGSLLHSARLAAIRGTAVHTLAVSGKAVDDARLISVRLSKDRVSAGTSVTVRVVGESSIPDEAVIRLFENGIEIDRTPVTLSPGKPFEASFTVTPRVRDFYRYRAVLERRDGSEGIQENNEVEAFLEATGPSKWLVAEGQAGASRYLKQALREQDISLEVRSAEVLPSSLHELAGFDGVILSDVSAGDLGETRMQLLSQYVESLGGGLVMLGGGQSFGLGGYQGTPVADMLPVKLDASDQEEEQSAAVALVIDRSGSMAGEKLDICKSAAIATAELLTDEDFIGVFAFDSQAHDVLPMTAISSGRNVASEISLLGSGGGTNIKPGLNRALEQLRTVPASVKHIIVLTDGQTAGEGYQPLAARIQAEGISISTVAVGAGAQVGLLQTIAAAGGGQSYVTMDPSAITRIFMQDTLLHTGKLVREDPFRAQSAEPHAILEDWEVEAAPPLLGYVKVQPKPLGQLLLVHPDGDPIMAHWRYGLGHVTAFTSDASSRWAALWIRSWPGYGQLWAQVLRHTGMQQGAGAVDLRFVERDDGNVLVKLDLLEDSSSNRMPSEIEGILFSGKAKELSEESITFTQVAPKLYEASFYPQGTGIHFVRVLYRGESVSAAYVSEAGREIASGQVDEGLLREVSRLSGGTFLESVDDELFLQTQGVGSSYSTWPWFLAMALLLFVMEICLRKREVIRALVGRRT